MSMPNGFRVKNTFIDSYERDDAQWEKAPSKAGSDPTSSRSSSVSDGEYGAARLRDDVKKWKLWGAEPTNNDNGIASRVVQPTIQHGEIGDDVHDDKLSCMASMASSDPPSARSSSISDSEHGAARLRDDVKPVKLWGAEFASNYNGIVSSAVQSTSEHVESGDRHQTHDETSQQPEEPKLTKAQQKEVKRLAREDQAMRRSRRQSLHHRDRRRRAKERAAGLAPPLTNTGSSSSTVPPTSVNITRAVPTGRVFGSERTGHKLSL